MCPEHISPQAAADSPKPADKSAKKRSSSKVSRINVDDFANLAKAVKIIIKIFSTLFKIMTALIKFDNLPSSTVLLSTVSISI